MSTRIPVANRFDSPVGKDLTGPLWPEQWYDATGCAANPADPSTGYYKLRGKWVWHTGADLNNDEGGLDSDAHAPVYATAAGRVIYARKAPFWGNVLIIQHVLPDGQFVTSRYAHMEAILVKPGQDVTRGQQVGRIGNADGQLGYHLHFDIAGTILLANPLDFPGDDKHAIERNYFDPMIFINEHRAEVVMREVTVMATVLNVRYGPGVNTPLLAWTFRRGERVAVLDPALENGWWKLYGRLGYVSGKWVKEG